MKNSLKIQVYSYHKCFHSKSQCSLKELKALVSRKDWLRSQEYSSASKRLLFLHQRVWAESFLKNHLLKTKQHRALKSFALTKSKFGKPHIQNNSLYFSITHTKGSFVIASSPKPVGIDLEYFHSRNYEALAEKFFHPAEAKYIRNSLQVERSFFEIWTTKEAYVKHQGSRLSQTLKLLTKEQINAKGLVSKQ